MSPFDGLPLDIVHIIFFHCKPTDHNPYICASEPPMLLTHICQAWRKTALEMPLLWANLHVHIPLYPEVPTRHDAQTEYRVWSNNSDDLQERERKAYLQAVDYWVSKMQELKSMVITWLSRAQLCHVALSLSQFTNLLDNTKGCNEINDIVAVLLAWRAQWKSLELYASSPIIAQFLAVPTHDAPNLQRISIKWQTPLERNMNRSTNKLALVSPEGLMTVPELKFLSLQILPRNIMSLPVRWHGLTELIFDEYYALDSESLRRRFLPSDALELLALCPRLRRCRLAIGRGRMFTVTPTPSSSNSSSSSESDRTPVPKTIPLLWLEHLAIDEGIPLGDFFLCLHLPSLREVVFSTALTPYESEEDSLSPPQQSRGSGGSPMSSPSHGLVGHLPYIPSNQSSRQTPSSSPLLDLLSQCGRNLQKLMFDEAGLSVCDIERALELVPSLTHLTMSRKSLLRCSNVSSAWGAGRWKPAPGHLTVALLERLTPKPYVGDVRKEQEEADVTAWLCPRLMSFSCRVSAPVLMQDTLIEFLQQRRQPSAPEPSALLQKCTINFNSPSSAIMSPDDSVGDLKNIASELTKLNVDMADFDLNVIYPSRFGKPLQTGTRGGSSGSAVAAGKGSGRVGVASMMSHFVPGCRGISAGMYGYGSWYATGGGGELQVRDTWFEAW